MNFQKHLFVYDIKNDTKIKVGATRLLQKYRQMSLFQNRSSIENSA